MTRKMVLTGIGGLLTLIVVSLFIQALKLTLKLAVPLLVLLLVLYVINEIREGWKD